MSLSQIYEGHNTTLVSENVNYNQINFDCSDRLSEEVVHVWEEKIECQNMYVNRIYSIEHWAVQACSGKNLWKATKTCVRSSFQTDSLLFYWTWIVKTPLLNDNYLIFRKTPQNVWPKYKFKKPSKHKNHLITLFI